MCKFCEGLFKKQSTIEWNMRNEYDDSNFCEKVFHGTCENCIRCLVKYNLNGYIHNDNAYIQCEYKFTNGFITMRNNTEPLRINYCPYCGAQLSTQPIDFSEIGSHIVNMIDKK